MVFYGKCCYHLCLIVVQLSLEPLIFCFYSMELLLVGGEDQITVLFRALERLRDGRAERLG
jgi:hypothetical protein